MTIKILYSHMGHSGFERELREIEIQSAGKYSIYPLNHRKELGWDRDITPWALDELFRKKDGNLLGFYKKVQEICEKMDVFLVDHECVYHPDLIIELSKVVYTVIYSGDDPESSYLRSKPYLYAFDHAFCYGVYHNEEQKMTEKFLEWGAKRADFRPHGCWMKSFDPNLTEKDILEKYRPIDLVFVGGMANQQRDEFLLRLKRHFGKRFALYGNWGGLRGMLKRCLKGFGIMPIRTLPSNELVRLYHRSKIGINIHQSFGPCNLRLYELPMNGVMQICDNKKGLTEIYELDHEVVGYENFDECVKLIEFYLNDDYQRKKIALCGFRKAQRKYPFWKTFCSAMEKVITALGRRNQEDVVRRKPDLL